MEKKLEFERFEEVKTIKRQKTGRFRKRKLEKQIQLEIAEKNRTRGEELAQLDNPEVEKIKKELERKEQIDLEK